MMNRRTFTCLALTAGAGLLVSACSSGGTKAPTIREVFNSNASFSTLSRALAQAGVELLGSTGPFTVFAPRNSAFDKLPRASSTG